MKPNDTKVFESCPNCGSKERLIANQIQVLKDQGHINQAAYPEGAAVTPLNLIDSGKQPVIISQVMTVRVLLIFWDVCEDCGTKYCTKATYKEEQVPVRFQDAQGRPVQMPGVPPVPGMGNNQPHFS